MVDPVVYIGEMRNEDNILYGIPEERERSLGRPRRKWEENFQMDLKEGRW
jgi:hypothetical protein